MIHLALSQPYLRFFGDVISAPHAKTACGLRGWARKSCVGEYALPALVEALERNRFTIRSAL
jgi:hypothetical protein